MDHWVVVLLAVGLPVVVMAAVLVAALAARRRMGQRVHAGTGLDEWRVTAAGLPRRDRRLVNHAARRGREAPRRLAGLTVQRAEMGAAVAERWLADRSGMRALWRLTVVMLGLAAGAGLMNALLDPSILRWSTVGCYVVATLSWCAVPAGQRRLRRRFRRAVELNRAQLDAPGFRGGS